MRHTFSLRRAAAAALLMIALAACGPAQPQLPTVQPQSPTVQPQPPTAQPQPPTIAFNPQSGGPGTVVTISGWGFAPSAPVAVRLGLPQPTGEVLAAAAAQESGRWSATFTMPHALPSGNAIPGGELLLVAMNDQNVALASAPFAFTREATGPTREAASATVHSFLEAYFGGGDATAFLGGALLDELRAGRPLHQFVGDQPGYQGFTVFAPEDRPSEVLFVRADVTYNGAAVEHMFSLAVANGRWVIVGVSATGGSSNQTPGDSQNWQAGISGDMNGDGVPEQLAYRPAAIELRSADFTDPAIVSLMVVEEFTVQMEASPGGRQLLHLSTATLTAEGTMLTAFDSGALPAGFLVVVYGGERHSFRITPLQADGQFFGNLSYEVVWNSEAQGFRLR